MKIVGIDPGTSPALAFLTFPNTGCRVLRIPEGHHCPDETALFRALKDEAPSRAVVELIGPMSGQGLASTAHLMTSWGMIRGVLTGMGIPYVLVTPQAWKAALLSDAERGLGIKDLGDRKEHQKAAAVAQVRRRYPAINLIPGKCRTPDHNLAEAVLLAVYGGTHGA